MPDARRDDGRPQRLPEPWPPEQVRQVTGMFLSLADEALPGLVEGLYLHGSLGFGEWYDGRSDVDFVAVGAARLEAATVAVLRDIHGRLTETFPRPPFDGFYLTWDDLTRSPYDCPDVPSTLGGEFHDQGRADVNPVTWHELAGHSLTVRGPALQEVEVRADRAELRRYSRANLEEYWKPQIDALALFAAEGARPDVLAWYVLGVTRLHHLLATDGLTSKDGAGRYALEVFDGRWRLLVNQALTYRAIGELVGPIDAEELGAQVVEFCDMVVRSGLAIDP